VRHPNFVEPHMNGSRVDACQWSDDIDATPTVWCNAVPVYEIANRQGNVFLSCVDHAYQARNDPRGVTRIASLRTVKAPR